MDTQETSDWGINVVDPTTLRLYHAHLPQIDMRFLSRNLKNFTEIESLPDRSIVLRSETPLDREILSSEILQILKEREGSLATTQNFTYSVSEKARDFLKNWFLSVEGAIALILISQCESLRLKPYDFELLDSEVGGIYVHPFTILFYENFAKAIHPISVSNFFLREQIERNISISMKGILQRVEDSQRGFEGLAILSYVIERTELSPQMIESVLNEKARAVKTPKHSPLFR